MPRSRQRHSPLLSEEALSLYQGLAAATLSAVAVWIWYLAMEPYVRRWWPRTLITWTRLLQGRLGDTLLGRDILVGGVFGLGLVLVAQCDSLLPTWLHLPEPVSAWYAPASNFTVVLVAGLLVYGTYRSLPRRSVFQGRSAGP
ncbi:MAG: hypothetical protein JW818_21465 [Pirellulales bacterium]|nr:hypothetical protein [Pirellulales bacterium]